MNALAPNRADPRALSLLLLVVLSLAAVPAVARSATPGAARFAAGLFTGWAALDEDVQLGNAPDPAMRPGAGPLFGGRVDVRLSSPLALEAEVDCKLASFRDSNLAATIVGFRANALWHFTEGQLRPFALVGLGAESLLWREYGTEHDTDLAAQLGAGLTIAFGDQLGARIDLRYFPMDGAKATLSHNFAIHLGLAIALPEESGDRDGDGIDDPLDRCPAAAEDIDGFEDGDGCPESDNDRDGLQDDVDKCPLEAEDMDGFEDGDGCPDPDNDRDGVLDSADKCPLQAEDKDGFEDADGCPDPDNDGDGVPDADDRCPNAVGQAQDGGCPPPDADGDGIPDRTDKCPNEPETYNGVKDDDGCPDGKETVVTDDKSIRILEKVYFEAGRAEIKTRSHKLLDSVAAVLRSRPRLTLVAVDGHTDDVGDEAANLALARSRAEAVVAYLVGKGVATARLRANSHGATRPLCGDLAALLRDEQRNRRKVATCREANRRVEFNVLEVDGRPVPSTAPGGQASRSAPSSGKVPPP